MSYLDRYEAWAGSVSKSYLDSQQWRLNLWYRRKIIIQGISSLATMKHKESSRLNRNNNPSRSASLLAQGRILQRSRKKLSSTSIGIGSSPNTFGRVGGVAKRAERGQVAGLCCIS